MQAVNINNGKTFWLIEDSNISKKSNILAIRSFDDNIEIYLNNGDVLIIYNKELIKINSLGVKNITKINFEKQNIIVNTKNRKTIIF